MSNRATAAYAVIFLAFASAGLAEGIPDRIQNMQDDPNVPLIWISEAELKRAMDAEDQPEGSRLRSVEHLFGYLEGGRLLGSLGWGEFKIAQDGTLICEPKPQSVYMGGETASDIRSLVELSRAILSVRVVGSEQGAAYGTGGELIEVEVLSVLKNVEPGGPGTELPTVVYIDSGPHTGPPVSEDGFYLFDVYARMVIDGRAYCLGTRQVPRGEFVLFFGDTWPEIRSALPLYGLHKAALVAVDGSFYGNLLARHLAVPQDELARQLANLEQIIAGKP